ncbi:hypothetical protein [Cobetia crustatorum]|uniref:Uncharacterized protein n=1 Tax=Cobetia crustatorum TaxID=553385 RepID=A0A558HSE6_9GAMM|nr:hypothetical protein [Cobetia crustatorum]TVU72014.1 hypothetical protein FQP86_05695 [Cobetia crustatorum]
MEEKLKRLKEFNKQLQPTQRKKRKWYERTKVYKVYEWLVQPSQRRTCRWCKSKIQPSAFMCASCQQPQKKRHWLLAHPSVAAASLSVVISIISLIVANNPPPAAPKIGAYIGEYGKESFNFTAFNYGNAPTALSAVELDLELRDNGTTHTSHAYYALEEPLFLPIGSIPKFVTIDYDSLEPVTAKWTRTGEDKEFNLGFLSFAAALGNNLECEIKLWYSANEGIYNHDSSVLHSNGNCVRAMAWMAQSFGPFKGKPITDKDWIYTVEAQSKR